LSKQIGKGGFSSVYRYEDTATGEHVAVKIMTSTDLEDFERKRQEIIIMEKLKDYKNIVQIKNYVFHRESE
jgi:serine/threonine protein kinase